MCFTFTQQLKVGDKGEYLLKNHYPYPIVKSEKDLAYDFYCSALDKTIELKSDTYSIDKTPNFFMERYSDLARDKPGGPWRALEDKVDIFIYMFINDGIYWHFDDVPALVKRLDSIVSGLHMTKVNNTSWTTGGYRVKRELLADLATIHTITETK